VEMPIIMIARRCTTYQYGKIVTKCYLKSLLW